MTGEYYGILDSYYQPADKTGEGYNEWQVRSFDDLEANRQKSIRGEKPARAQHPIPSGTLVTIFNTITEGEVLWSGKVTFKYKDRLKPNQPQGIAHNAPPKEWASMFADHLPARLEKKDGSVVYGALERHMETGMGWVTASLLEYGQSGYASLHYIEEGEKLTVYKSVTKGDIFWQGKLDLREYAKPQPMNYLPDQTARRKFNDSAARKIEQAFICNYPVRIDPNFGSNPPPKR